MGRRTVEKGTMRRPWGRMGVGEIGKALVSWSGVGCGWRGRTSVLMLGGIRAA